MPKIDHNSIVAPDWHPKDIGRHDVISKIETFLSMSKEEKIKYSDSMVRTKIIHHPLNEGGVRIITSRGHIKQGDVISEWLYDNKVIKDSPDDDRLAEAVGEYHYLKFSQTDEKYTYHISPEALSKCTAYNMRAWEGSPYVRNNVSNIHVIHEDSKHFLTIAKCDSEAGTELVVPYHSDTISYLHKHHKREMENDHMFDIKYVKVSLKHSKNY